MAKKGGNAGITLVPGWETSHGREFHFFTTSDIRISDFRFKQVLFSRKSVIGKRTVVTLKKIIKENGGEKNA